MKLADIPEMTGFCEAPKQVRYHYVLLTAGGNEQKRTFLTMKAEAISHSEVDSDFWYRYVADNRDFDEVRVRGGGFLIVKDKTIQIIGASESYGKADPKMVREILQRNLEGYNIIND